MKSNGSWQQKFSSKSRLYEPVVVFVPHFGGTIPSMRRHIEFVNELGFDAVAIHLSHNHWRDSHPLPLTSQLEFGLRHMWADEIERALNSINEKKIVYSFSFPSVSALEALARRNASDIEGWVCEGGPFLDIYKCTWNLFTHAIRLKNIGLRALVTAFSPTWLGALNYEKDIRAYLERLPKRFPVLSIRSWQDRLVPPSAIDEIFDGQDHLQYQVLSLPESDHLMSLLQCPEDYKPRVALFLKQISRQISNGHSLEQTNP